MVWLLQPSDGGAALLLRLGSAQIGRAQTTQIRSTHQSVSRVHAEVVVAPLDPTSLERPAIHILDRSSTGHTFVNGQPAGRNVQRPLAEGDLISVGIDPVTYILCWQPFVFSYSSRMPPAEILKLQEKAKMAGASIMPGWTNDCTHLLMEELAITPKFLCCVIDGRLPVSRSFLEALANPPPHGNHLLGTLPQPQQHQPGPPSGQDASLKAELQKCLAEPRVRQQLLKGIWVLFGLSHAQDALSCALLRAGSPVHLDCSTSARASSAAEDLRRHVGAHGHPKEVWIIPSIQDAAAAVVAAPLKELGARCLIVPQVAVARCILLGQLEAAHAQASPFQAPAPRAPPVESPFPDTLIQPDRAEKPPAPPAPVRQASFMFPPPKPEPDPPRDPKPPVAAASAAPAQASTKRRLPWEATEAKAPSLQLSVKEEEKPDAGEGEATQQAAPPSMKASRTSLDLPWSTLKVEPPPTAVAERTTQPKELQSLRVVESSSIGLVGPWRHVKEEKKEEEKCPPEVVAEVQAREVEIEVEEQPEVRVHPTGVWLTLLRPPARPAVTMVDGMEVVQASWAPVIRELRRGKRAASSEGQGSISVKGRKTFKKAAGQLAASGARRRTVALSAFVAPPPAPLSELFPPPPEPEGDSQQLPSMGLWGR